MKRLSIILFYIIGISTITHCTAVFAEGNDSLVTALNAKAVDLCQSKKYADSEKTFKQLFRIQGAVLPDEGAYYYGVASFYLKKYEQARKAFDRFETLAQAADSLKKESVEFRYYMDCY